MTEFADLEISLQRRDQGAFQARLSFRPAGSDARRGIPPQLLRFDREALDALDADPAAYGQALARQLFAGQIGTFFAEARAAAASQDVALRVRLQIGPQAHHLHELRWETLGDPDPETDGFLCADERLLFSRYISSSDRRLVAARPRGDLKALVVIADPIDLAAWGFASIDVAGELVRARDALGEIPWVALCRPDEARILGTGVPILDPPTLKAVIAHLRDGYDFLYLVCHGRLVHGQPWLWLEVEDGTADRVPGAEDLVQAGRRPGLVARLGDLPQLPRLVVLASCESAGASADDGALAALGPLLAESGVPAVVAMQGSVTMETVARFMPTFFRELLRDGQVDRAMAAARADVIDDARPDWWMPVLFSRLDSGRLFADEPQRTPDSRPAAPAPFTVPFPRNPRFVGREEELEALHRLLHGEGEAAPVGITPAGISGMGGIGKTQLAVEYAYRHRDDYSGGVFWVNAARVEDWAQELVALADRAGLAPADPASPDRTGQMVAALSRYLQRRPRSLLIFDNVTDPRHLQTARLGPGIAPAGLGGALLFTTRRRDLPPGLATMDVEVLPRAASRRMILAARPEAAGDPALEQLCATLGDLPLALELAAAALRHRPRLSLAAYLENLERLGADVVHDKARVTPGDLATYYAASLTPALQAQWDALQDGNACLLLRAAAQLDEAELVPVARLGLLTGLRDDDDGLEEPLSDALRELEANALVEPIQAGAARAGRRLRLHPLVREFVARQEAEAGIPAFRGSLAANLAAAYRDIARLEAHCARRGVDALQHDLLTALGLLDQTSEVFRDLRGLESHFRTLLRLLQREAHNLRGWDPDERPAFFAQQVGMQATELGQAELAGAAEGHMARGTAPYLGLQWRASAGSPALERTLAGHEAGVLAVAVTPDGRRAVSASSDRTLRVWDLATGGELARLTGHEDWVRAVAVTPDGRRAVSASDDRTLRVWDLATGGELARLTGHEDGVRAVAVTPDGRRAVSASSDRTLRVWDTETGRELAMVALEGSLECALLAPDGTTIVAGDRAGNVYCLRYVEPGRDG